MNLGAAIKSLRKKKGFGQGDVCNKIGITQTYLSLVEGNRKFPSVDVIQGIADALDISVAVIYVTAIDVSDIYNNDPGDKSVVFLLESGKQFLLQAL